MPEPNCIEAVINWGACKNVSKIDVFLGTVGIGRIFIKDYVKKVNPLNRLLCKDVPFEWGPAQEQAMDELKRALLHLPALRPIDYDSEAPVILAINTSKIAVGYQLCQ